MNNNGVRVCADKFGATRGRFGNARKITVRGCAHLHLALRKCAHLDLALRGVDLVMRKK